MKIDLEKALYYLKHSHPVAIPTETVWGLAACLTDETGIQNIYSLKRRPSANPLIIHLAHAQDVMTYALDPLPPGTHALMTEFWPGPLTLVLPCKEELIPSIARASLSTAGFRVPKDMDTLALLEKSGPLVAPSANLSGRPSATESKHVEEDFGFDFPCLETNAICHFGIESTILIYKEDRWHVGRLGALSLEAISSLLGYKPVKLAADKKPLCPGQTYRHYAPKAKLSLSRSSWDMSWANHVDAVLGFHDRTYELAPCFLPLGLSDDPLACQRALFRTLRLLDSLQKKHAWVDCSIPITHEWDAFFDRLIKASSP